MLQMSVKDMVQIIVQAMVDKSGEVSVSEIKGGQTTVLELKVAGNDLGKVIGKQGRNVQAMGTILSSVSAKIKKRVVLQIIE